MYPIPAPVAGFQLVGVDVVALEDSEVQGYEARQKRLHNFRKGGGTFLNPQNLTFDIDQLQALGVLREFFLLPHSFPM